MRRSFIVLEGAYNAKTASAVFLILKKTYLPAGSVIICSIGWAVLFASTKTPRVYVFPGKIKTSPSQSSLMSCRWEKFTCVSCKMKKSEFNVLQQLITKSFLLFSLILPVLTDIMLHVTSNLKKVKQEKGVYLQWESNQNQRIQSSE